MFNFLNTAILAAAAAAMIPFLLHLFSKRKVKVVPFSSIAFLKAMQKRQVRSIKIKQILLLVIRTLIILAVVLAFARPATQSGYLGSHATVSAVILLDNSASMGLSVKDGRLFDLAVKRAKNIARQLGQADEVVVLATVGEFSQIGNDDAFGNPATAENILDQIELTDGRADLSESINRAAQLIAGRQNLNREIYLVSDIQQNSVTPEQAIENFEGKLIMVDLPGDQSENNSIIEVDLGNQLIEVGTDFSITATIKNRSGEAGGEILVSLYLDDNRVAQRGMRLQPGQSLSESFTLSVNEPGFHGGYVAISDDDFLADNTCYFTFYIPDQFNVLLVGDDNLDTRLFKLALAPEENLRRHWSVQQAPYTMFPSLRLNDYDVLILSNYPSLAGGDIARIREFVSRGGGVLINLGQKTDSANYNNYLSDLTGVRLLSSFPKEFSRQGYYMLSDFSLDHQILSVFDQIDMPDFKAYARAKSEMTGTTEARLLARWSDGSPAVAVAPSGRGRIMLLNCDITPDISDLSLHPFFVPFISRSVEYLSSDFSSHNEGELAGASPRRNLRHGFNVRGEYTLETPAGQRRVVSGEYRDDIYSVACDRLDLNGIYSIWNDSRESDRFAVNLDPEEGDLYRLDENEIENYLNGAIRMSYSADLAGFIAEKRFGRELWQYFLIGALLLLILEMYIARHRSGAIESDE